MTTCFAALLATLTLLVHPAIAGVILLSGDSNLGNAIDGSSGFPVTPGNRTFFSNVLQGSTHVVVFDAGNLTQSAISSEAAINTYYNTLVGVTSTVVNVAGGFSAVTLSGENVAIAMLPSAYTSPELSAFSAFLAGGGTIFFMGENGFAGSNAAIAAINDALTALGSGMRIVPDLLDGGAHTAIGAQIAANPFTAGVTSFTYAAVSQTSGGTPLFFTTQGLPFVAVEAGASSVPEPSTWLLLGSGLVGLILWRKRTA
jgi:hypothetical protein